MICREPFIFPTTEGDKNNGTVVDVVLHGNQRRIDMKRKLVNNVLQGNFKGKFTYDKRRNSLDFYSLQSESSDVSF